MSGSLAEQLFRAGYGSAETVEAASEQVFSDTPDYSKHEPLGRPRGEHPTRGIWKAEPGDLVMLKMCFGPNDRHSRASNIRPAIVMAGYNDNGGNLRAMEVIFPTSAGEIDKSSLDIFVETRDEAQRFLYDASANHRGVLQITGAERHLVANRGIHHERNGFYLRGGTVACPAAVGRVRPELMADIVRSRVHHLLRNGGGCETFSHTKVAHLTRHGITLPRHRWMEENFRAPDVEPPEGKTDCVEARVFSGGGLTEKQAADIVAFSTWEIENRKKLTGNTIGQWPNWPEFQRYCAWEEHRAWQVKEESAPQESQPDSAPAP